MIDEDRLFLTATNGNVSHTCGNIASFITEYFKSHFRKGFFKETKTTTSIAVRQFKNIKKHLIEYKMSKPYLIVQPKLIPDRTDANVEMFRRLYGTNMHDLLTNDAACKFFKDMEKDIIVDFAIERLKMSFEFTMVFDTEYQQYNVAMHINNNFRIEHPYYIPCIIENIIPENIIRLISQQSGIPILDEDGSPYRFLDYMNTVSNLPITLELQPATGKYRFHLMMPISLFVQFDQFDVSDPEYENMSIDSCPITMRLNMEFNYPSRYFFISNQQPPNYSNEEAMSEEYDDVDQQYRFYYTLKQTIIPEEDENRKAFQRMVTFTVDDNDEDSIDIKSLFTRDQINLMNILKNDGRSIDELFNLVIYEDGNLFNRENYEVDYDKLLLKVFNTKEIMTYKLCIYMDNKIMNDYILRLHKEQQKIW